MPAPDRPTHVFQTTQPRELLACVEFSAMQAERLTEDVGAWRWLIVSMTLGVQNACICALDGMDGDGSRAMRRVDALEVRRWTRSGRRVPPPDAVREPRIVSPLELLRRVSDSRFLPPPFQLHLTEDLREDFDALVELRNTFLHFSEDGWRMDLTELPPLMLSACAIIRHLAVTQPSWRKLAEKWHAGRIVAALDTIESVMDFLAAQPSDGDV